MTNDTNKTGKVYWRSLDELAGTPEFREFIQREYPQGASELDNGWSRRNFIQLMGASLALAGLAGCRRPIEKVVPYVTQPEEITPGVPGYYATTMPFGISAHGLVVKTNEGRPTKIEGNREHPSSFGGTNIYHQAAILGMYDPDRSKRVMHKGAEDSWDNFVSYWRERFAHFSANQGQGLAVLTESFNSPTLARLLSDFRKAFPKATVAAFEPISDENIYEGIRIATGKILQPVYSVSKAQVILSLDSDFLQTESENVMAMLGFADGRRVKSRNDEMNRLYVAESSLSVTGGMADHRLRIQSRRIGELALALSGELARLGITPGLPVDAARPNLSESEKKWVAAVARDLAGSRGKCLILAGRRQPSSVHALILALNQKLGNISNTISYRELPDALIPSRAQLAGLAKSLAAGSIDTLVMLGGNPAYSAPADLEFEAALGKVPHSVQLASHVNESSRLVEWHIPEAHFLESWGDARSVDGTASIVQPMIEPLFGGKSAAEILALVGSGQDLRGYDIVQQTWKGLFPALSFENVWRKTLHDGVLADSALPEVKPDINGPSVAAIIKSNQPVSTSQSGDTFEFIFTVSNLYDGRFANNGWLQELPDPITRLTWDNVLSIGSADAKRLGLNNGDMARLEAGGRSVELPVWIAPGQADKSIGLMLGYGQIGIGKIAEGVGVNVSRVRSLDSFDIGTGARLTSVGSSYDLASVQSQATMEGRPIVREATLEAYRKGEEFRPTLIEHPPLAPLWTDEHKYDTGYQWGMSIDLNACTGCNACTIACQSENNIPIVGKEQVSNGRVMHWIRVDRYYSGAVETPEIVHQPVPCQHCENAPCENVCPVGATVHDSEGLNVQVYNRCIGTRYCSNNCPYKVRRFNFFNYTKDLPETVRMQQNPDVTVRSRGVMEKCTYCVQRISEAKITAKEEGRLVADGELLTACQQACPAKVIVFGNINDSQSKVAVLKKFDRDYAMLGELNVRPRTTYLAKIRNPNPELENFGG
jgi:MoCo/4Fe-4S cofactor protein with predicted Tat translocation signal